jgi:predicted GH43/DUF377 family glycosyl hydrolase
MSDSRKSIIGHFERLEITLTPTDLGTAPNWVLNPGAARLPDGTLQLYPRIVSPGNVSRIGSYRASERADGTLLLASCGDALVPEAPYELRDLPGGYGCEDPRVTYIPIIERYVMAYVGFGPRGPEVALALSSDGLKWQRLGLMCFADGEPFADKDAAFFPEPVRSPGGILSLAFYHRPTLLISVREGQLAAPHLRALLPDQREQIAIGYVSLADVQSDLTKLCNVAETHRLEMPSAAWGQIKVGAGTPPVRIDEGWLSVIHGVDELEHPSGAALLRYCAGVIVHDPNHLDRVVYRSQAPLFVPTIPGEISGTVGHVVFPTGIDPRPDIGPLVFDIYYGMADYAIGRGRLTLT